MSQEMNLPGSGAAAEVAAAPPKASGFKGLGEVIVSPTAYFKKVKQSPTILVPYLVIAIIFFVFFALASDIIVDMQLRMPEAAQQLQDKGVTPEQARAFMKPSTMIGAPIFFLLAPLVIAGLAMLWGNFVFAGRARFSQVLSVAVWGEYIYALGMLAVLPLVLAKGTMLVSFSLAAFVPQLGPENFWYVLLSKISVFNIWELIVIGIGLSIVYEFPRNKGMWLSVLSIGLLLIVQIAWVGIKTLF